MSRECKNKQHVVSQQMLIIFIVLTVVEKALLSQAQLSQDRIDANKRDLMQYAEVQLHVSLVIAAGKTLLEAICLTAGSFLVSRQTCDQTADRGRVKSILVLRN